MADTVALMKQRVLDMAIRGELVEQRSEEGTAEELNKKFQSVGKKKMSKIEIDKNEKPFDLPSSWMWVRLNEVGEIIGGGTPKTKVDEYWDNGTVPWISPADLTGYKKKYISKGRKNITELGLKKSSARLMPKGTVLFSSRAPIGYVAISSNEIATNQGFKSVVPYILDTNEYIYYYFQAFLDNIKDRSSGTTFKEISGSELGKSVFPLPPLQEQRRIVAKIEEIFAVIDQIGTKKEEALSIIKNMRQAALRDAIMGVLVEQDENDEPASVLYEKIQAEKEKLIKEKKIKKEKLLPEIEVDEIPFDIPESWKWVRLGYVTNFASHKSVSPSEIEADARLYELEDIESMSGKIIQSKSMDDRISKSNKYVVEAGDILYGKLRPYLNKVACAPEDGYCSTEIFPLKFYGISEGRFLQYFLRSEYFVEYANRNSQGTKMPRLGSILGKHAIMPLPPLAEQERIVEKIEEIMAICDQMETIFDGTSEMNTNLNVV